MLTSGITWMAFLISLSFLSIGAEVIISCGNKANSLRIICTAGAVFVPFGTFDVD